MEYKFNISVKECIANSCAFFENLDIMKKFTKRAVLRVLALVILFVIFFFNYLKPIVIQWSNGITNTAKHEEPITDVEPPAITVCFEPKFKPSVFNMHNITEDIFYVNAFPDVVVNNTIKVIYVLYRY